MMQTVSTMRLEGVVVVNTRSHSYRGRLASLNAAVLVMEMPDGRKLAVPTPAVRMVRPLGKDEKL